MFKFFPLFLSVTAVAAKGDCTLPHLHIIPEANISAEKKVNSRIQLYSDCTKLVKTYRATIKHRGNTSLHFPKKQFSVELKDSNGKDFKAPLLGLPKDDDWIFNGPFADKSLVRNALMYKLSRDIGRYAPRTRWMTLSQRTPSGEVDELGLYLLIERIELAPHKVNLPKETPEGPSILGEFDRIKPGTKFSINNIQLGMRTYSKSNVGAVIKYPKRKKISDVVAAEITDKIIEQSHNIISQHSIEEQIDYASAIDFILLNEMAMNPDAFVYSSYFHKTYHGKIYFGPIWDFNYALGNNPTKRGNKHTEWRYKGFSWWYTLMEQPEFKKQLIERWFYLRKNVLTLKNVYATADALIKPAEPYIAENFARWQVLGKKRWISPTQFKTHAEELKYVRKTLIARMTWMDKQLKEWWNEMR